MRWCRNLIFISLGLGITSQAMAGQTQCQMQDIVRCLCKASVKVSCDNNTQGYIANATSITSIRIKTIDDVGIEKTVTLQNPPGSVSEYYAAKQNPWIQSQLSAQGIRFKDVFGQSFTMATAPKLFADSNAQIVASAEPEATFADGIQCNSIAEPQIIPDPSPQGRKIWSMKVHCLQTTGSTTKNLGDGEAACKALADGKYPTATICAHDKDVSLDEGPSKSSTGGSLGSQKGVH